MSTQPDISVIVPVFNEEAVLADLCSRLYPAMDRLGRPWEVIFVDDGSRDKSPALLREQYQARPEVTRVVFLRANAGQHAALMAGFNQSVGNIVVTIDADLQNPPEEIVKLVEKMDEGHDYVGSIRNVRRDTWWRRAASKLMNLVRERITNIHMTDQGCMLRAYHRDIVLAMLASSESQTFIPALGYLYARDPAEVVVEHSERVAGESKYSLWKLVHLNFDLVTGFSIIPLQVFSVLGMVISMGSFLLVCLLVIRRLLIGPEVEGLFTLFAIAFFMIGLLLSAVGILGEYVGRIYVEVRKRPQYVIAAVLGEQVDAGAELRREKVDGRGG